MNRRGFFSALAASAFVALAAQTGFARTRIEVVDDDPPAAGDYYAMTIEGGGSYRVHRTSAKTGRKELIEEGSSYDLYDEERNAFTWSPSGTDSFSFEASVEM